MDILSFFTGGGFFDMGFEKAGFSVVYTNEYDNNIADLYGEGYSTWSGKNRSITSRKSITDLNAEEILRVAFFDNPPEFFGIIGGPPCQDFSTENNQKSYFSGDKGRMVVEYIIKIFELTPSFFVLENVPNILSEKTNNYFNELVKHLKELYYVDYKILNALQFGVPQSRRRLFCVGFLKTQFKDRPFNFEKYLKYENPAKDFDFPKITPSGETPVKPDNVPYELCVDSVLLDDNTDIANFETYKLKKTVFHVEEGNCKIRNFDRPHRYRYSPTVTHLPIIHPYLNRYLTVREHLRLQGVDDSYAFGKMKSLTVKFKLIGNGLPVPMAQGLANAIKDHIKENCIFKNSL